MKEKKGKGPGRPKGAPAKSASFRLPEELLAKLAEVSKRQDRSQTILVKRALEAWLKQHGGDE